MSTNSQRNDLVVANIGITGDVAVDGDVVVTGALSGADVTATSVTGLTFPVELAEAAVTAADLWTALAAAGILIEPEA